MSAPSGFASPAREPAPGRSRVFYWFFLAVQLLFAVVLVAGLVIGLTDVSALNSNGDFGGLAATFAGLRVLAAAGAVFAAWLVVNSFLAVTYFTYRKARDL